MSKSKNKTTNKQTPPKGLVLGGTIKAFWPVTINIPVDGGAFHPTTIELQFSNAEKDEFSQMRNAPISSEGNNAEAWAFLKKHIHGWHNVYGPDGEEMPFNKTSLDALFETSQAPMAIFESYTGFLMGRKAKN